MKKSAFLAMIGLISGTVLVGAPAPVLSVALDEGDFAAIKDSGPGRAEVKVVNPEFLQWVDGASGKALQFNNADGNAKRGAVLVRVPAGFDLAKGFTLTATVKTAPELLKKRIYSIFRFADGILKSNGVNVFFNWNMLWFRMGTAEKFADTQTKTSERSIQGDTWYRMVLTYDGTTAKIYLDGVLAGERALSVSNPVVHKNLCIGSTGDGAGYGFSGIIGGVQLFDHALTPEDIAELQKAE